MRNTAAEVDLGVLGVPRRGGHEVDQGARMIALRLEEDAALEIKSAVGKVELQGACELRGRLLVFALLAISHAQILISEHVVRVQPQGVTVVANSPIKIFFRGVSV